MTPNQFYGMLEKHDWFYMFSDDSGVCRDGKLKEKELHRIALETIGLSEMFINYRKYVFSYGDLNKPEKPKE